MFNPKEKQQFIDYKNSQAILPNDYLNRLFTDTQQMEYDLQLDVSDWDESIIIEYYKKKKTPSTHYLTVMNGRLAEYTDYINRISKDNKQNKYNNITTDILRTCIDEEKAKKRYLKRNDFYLSLNLLDNAVDKFVLTALFEGIKGKGFEQIWRLRLEDISKEEASLHMGRRIDLMDSKLYYYAHESAETDIYYTYGKTDAAIRMIGYSNQIIKMTNKKQHLEVNDDPIMIKRQDKNIFRKFERAANEIGWAEVKPRTLLLSGQIEYTKRIAEQYRISIEEVIKRPDLFEMIERRFIRIADKQEFLQATKYVLDETTSSD